MSEIIISFSHRATKTNNQQQANLMVKTIVSAVSSEREVERMVQESASTEGEPVRMRWVVKVHRDAGRNASRGKRTVASSQVVIGDDVCRLGECADEWGPSITSERLGLRWVRMWCRRCTTRRTNRLEGLTEGCQTVSAAPIVL